MAAVAAASLLLKEHHKLLISSSSSRRRRLPLRQLSTLLNRGGQTSAERCADGRSGCDGRILVKEPRLVKYFWGGGRCYSSRVGRGGTTASSAHSAGRCRLESTVAEPDDDLGQSDVEEEESESSDQFIDFPGGKLRFTSEMSFIDEDDPQGKVPCYRALAHNGNLLISSSSSSSQQAHPLITKETSIKIYKNMVTLQTMDTVLYEAQRQGRISFYLTTTGEEAINISSAAALSHNDIVFAQYREPGVLLWRGFTLQQFANQCFGNKDDYGKGRQMPNHYGSKKHNFFTISSPIGTQIPQAVGAAYALKMEKLEEECCVVCYMGDGATSEGDFHAGLNFAAVMEVPVVFICRNNGWAISTPSTQQFRSDGVVVKGRAYGIKSIRVDGNDAVAVYNVIQKARLMAIKSQKPILIEAMTYRVSHHSTSDDSTKYRPVTEIQRWKMVDRDPVIRFRRWIEINGWWGNENESELRTSVRKEMIQAISVAEKMKKPHISELFSDVYDQPTVDLLEQERKLIESIETHPSDYPAVT